MNAMEAIIKLYEGGENVENGSFSNNETLDNYFNEQEKKYIFLSEGIIGITTYDNELGAEFGKMILDTLVQIKNGTTFEYIKENKDNYKNYILSCNFIESWIEWGTSIRGAFFNTSGQIIPDEPLCNTGYEKEGIKITDEFMNWFINWLSK
jgi:hypothetical protein